MPEAPVLILSGVKGDTRRYRTFHPYEQLRLAGVNCQLSHITDPRLPEKASRARLVILHRLAMDRYVDRLLAGWQQQGAPVILDVDDLVFAPHAFQWINSPDFADPLPRCALPGRDAAAAECLRRLPGGHRFYRLSGYVRPPAG